MTLDNASIAAHVRELAEKIGARPVGSSANQRAERYIARVLEDAGLPVERQEFDAVDWQHQETHLMIAGKRLPALANPFSPPCAVTAPLVAVDKMDDLYNTHLGSRILVLHGALTFDALTPTNYPFYNVPDHAAVLKRLFEDPPLAVITVSHREENPAPLIEDGDFLLPSATVPASTGAALLEAGEGLATLEIRTALEPSTGANVIARRAVSSTLEPSPPIIMFCAHFDTKPETPGALDNAAGVAALLALAAALAEKLPGYVLEFVAFNGEDDYAAPGQVLYLAEREPELERFRLLLNFDGLGYKEKQVSVATFAVDESVDEAVDELLGHHPQVARVDPWPQGDHTIFWTRGVPSIAFSSTDVEELIDTVVHTAADTVDIVDPARIAAGVAYVQELLERLLT